MADRTAWRICHDNQWFSVFGRRTARGNGMRPGPAVHDDLVQRDFTAARPNQVWLTDITEHQTGQGKLYVCAVKDVFAGRIVGYSIDARMTSRLAVNALNNAVALRGNVAGCVVHSDRGSQFRSRKFVRALKRHGLIGSMGRVGAAGDNAAMNRSSRYCRTTYSIDNRGSHEMSFASQSSPGLNEPITAAADNTGSAG